MKTNDDMKAWMERVEQMIRPLPDDVWTQANVADYLKVSPDTARRMLKRPGAPQPLPLETDDKGRTTKPRYLRVRVIEWVENADRLSRCA